MIPVVAGLPTGHWRIGVNTVFRVWTSNSAVLAGTSPSVVEEGYEVKVGDAVGSNMIMTCGGRCERVLQKRGG